MKLATIKRKQRMKTEHKEKDLYKLRAKLKAIERLVEEWETQLPPQFYVMIRAILNS
jgi:hypothetical protein